MPDPTTTSADGLPTLQRSGVMSPDKKLKAFTVRFEFLNRNADFTEVVWASCAKNAMWRAADTKWFRECGASIGAIARATQVAK